jgi:hypothetical protein
MASLEPAIKESEGQLMALLEAGADFSHCGFAVSIQSSEKRYPKWKEEFISRLGKPLADEVLEGTSPTVHRKLVIK